VISREIFPKIKKIKNSHRAMNESIDRDSNHDFTHTLRMKFSVSRKRATNAAAARRNLLHGN
jgi:hypothetical protein